LHACIEGSQTAMKGERKRERERELVSIKVRKNGEDALYSI